MSEVKELISEDFWQRAYGILVSEHPQDKWAAWNLAHELLVKFEAFDNPENFWNLEWPPVFDSCLELMGNWSFYPLNPFVAMIREPSSLGRISMSKDEYIRASVAQHPRTPLESLTRLVADCDSFVATQALRHGNFPAEVLIQIAQCEGHCVACNASFCHDARYVIFADVSQEIHAEARANIAFNPVAPASLIETLRCDDNARVRRNAYLRAGTKLDLIESQDPTLLVSYQSLWDGMDLSQMTYEDCIRVYKLEPVSEGPLIRRLGERLMELTSNASLDDEKRVSAYFLAVAVGNWRPSFIF